jgi:hypothetical protein
MHLLNTSTLRLENANPNCYAILSHVWEREEVTYQDITEDPRPDALTKKLGFTKIQKACAQALSDGFKYIWIDTCCIENPAARNYPKR